MIKYYCDRCKREMESKDELTELILSTPKRGRRDDSSGLCGELCKDCANLIADHFAQEVHGNIVLSPTGKKNKEVERV